VSKTDATSMRTRRFTVDCCSSFFDVEEWIKGTSRRLAIDNSSTFGWPTLTSIDSIYSRTVPPSSRCALDSVEVEPVSNTTAGQFIILQESEQYSLTRDLPTLRSGFPESVSGTTRTAL